VLASLRQRVKSVLFDALPPTWLVRRGPDAARRVALTFDDGPDAMTRTYLDLLGELRVPATFFLVGNHCEREPGLTREYVERGHQIAGHGYDHKRFPALGYAALREQLRRTDAALGLHARATDAKTKDGATNRATRNWVRPPYGNLSARVLAQILAHRRTVALWSLDSMDYQTKDPDALVAHCAPSVVRPGEVILMHEGQQWTLDALPRIVHALRGAGYEMVTLAEMFRA
jgi:peptidoglycan/xylan/chitin deacetylase (PgdA/CDA1 family)